MFLTEDANVYFTSYPDIYISIMPNLFVKLPQLHYLPEENITMTVLSKFIWGVVYSDNFVNREGR